MAATSVMGGLTGCKNQTATDDTMIVDIVSVTSNADIRQSQYPGQTEAKDNTSLSFKVLGTIEKVYVKEGDHVKRGQLLARIDSRDYATQLEATESEYRQVKSECERVIAMHAEKAVSDNNYDKARSGLERITAKLKNHRDQLADCSIYAPYDGYVSQVYRSDREAAGPGIPVIGLFTSGAVEVVINVPETEQAHSRAGATYQAVFSALPGRSFPLRLESISHQANANQLFQVRLSLTDRVPEVTPGMSAVVMIGRKEQAGDDKTQVPVGAILGTGKDTFVFVYNSSDSTVSQTPVTVERILANGHAVITHGLKSAQKVVASGVSKLTDGQRVKPLPEISSENAGALL